MRTRTTARAAIAALCFGLAQASAPMVDRPVYAAAETRNFKPSDFDGDGFSDLVVAAPDETVSGAGLAGAVHVVYGGPIELDVANGPGTQFFTQASIDSTPGIVEAGNRFGAAVAAGDFNGDGDGDLAIGVPGLDDGGASDSGGVYVLYGNPQGLRVDSAVARQLFQQSSPGVSGDPETDDHFGAALAAGDFDGDNRTDLAIGVPDENVGAVEDAGAVVTIYGSPTGLRTDVGKVSQLFTQSTSGIASSVGAGDRFGATLAAACMHLDDTGEFEDLAVGAPFEDLEDFDGIVRTDCGIVSVLKGSTDGLSGANSISLMPFLSLRASGANAERARFGSALGPVISKGSVFRSGAGTSGLAVGLPGLRNGQGAVLVFYQHQIELGIHDLDPGDSDFIDQPANAVDPGRESGDGFGSALAVGDFNADNIDDLAVGVPSEDVGSAADIGAVTVLYGTPNGVVTLGSQFLTLSAAAEPGGSGAGAHFGAAVSAGNFSGPEVNTREGFAADLVVGAPDAKPPGFARPGQPSPRGGVALVFYGARFDGLPTSGVRTWSHNTAGVADAMETGDEFGAVLR